MTSEASEFFEMTMGTTMEMSNDGTTMKVIRRLRRKPLVTYRLPERGEPGLDFPAGDRWRAKVTKSCSSTGKSEKEGILAGQRVMDDREEVVVMNLTGDCGVMKKRRERRKNYWELPLYHPLGRLAQSLPRLDPEYIRNGGWTGTEASRVANGGVMNVAIDDRATVSSSVFGSGAGLDGGGLGPKKNSGGNRRRRGGASGRRRVREADEDVACRTKRVQVTSRGGIEDGESSGESVMAEDQVMQTIEGQVEIRDQRCGTVTARGRRNRAGLRRSASLDADSWEENSTWEVRDYI